MAGIDLSTAESRLQEALDAEAKVLSGQSVSFDGRTLTRADLAQIAERIDYWDRRCKRLDPRGRAAAVSRIVSARG
jgi:hypothetical protein